MNEADVMSYNPFDGDFGAPGDRLLRDRIVTARSGGDCHLCGGKIQPGTRIRSRSGVIDGSLMSWRWCTACCEAMALSWTDDGKALEARYIERLCPSKANDGFYSKAECVAAGVCTCAARGEPT